MASAYVSDSNKINKNPKNFIPELRKYNLN